MKKAYETPSAEVLEFNYADTVIASAQPMTNTDQDSTQCTHDAHDWTFVKHTDGCEKDHTIVKHNKCE